MEAVFLLFQSIKNKKLLSTRLVLFRSKQFKLIWNEVNEHMNS